VGRDSEDWLGSQDADTLVCVARLSRTGRVLDDFLEAAPWPQRTGLRALLALARRRRGATLLLHIPPARLIVGGLLAMERYESEPAARALGWDSAAVVARGRALRRAEGRP
jgi:hypothetical protein